MKILRVIMGAAVVFSVLFTVFFGAAKISEEKELVTRSEYKGVITVWQIDSFEGGTGSRRQFLFSRAKEFAKDYEGVLFLVSDHTKESAEENFKRGIYPDVISFGGGVSVSGAAEFPAGLFFKGGAVGGKTYATPWCRGAYVLLKHKKFIEEKENSEKKLTSVIVSQGDFTMPLMAAFIGGYEIEKYQSYKPFDAYTNFLLGKTPYLIGTQRDIIRLKARGESFSFSPIEGFSDLYQYAAVLSKDKEKEKIAEDYVRYLLSEKSQTALSEISMLPVISGVNISDELGELYKADVSFTVSAFLSGDTISQTNKNLEEFYSGDKSLYAKIKNVVI